jgi:hypothetical protein
MVDSQPVELAAIAERSTITQAASRREGGSFGSVSREMASDPCLPVGEERGDLRLGARPATPVQARDRDGHALARVDDDSQRPRLGRATEDVPEAAAGEVDRGGLLRDNPAGGLARHRAR